MTTFTYQNIADVIADLPCGFDEPYWVNSNITTREEMALTFIAKMTDNPRFDRKRFLKACGVHKDSVVFNDDGYEECMGQWVKIGHDPYDASDPESRIHDIRATISPDNPAYGCGMMAEILR